MKSLISDEGNRYAKRFYQLLLDEGYALVDDCRYKTSNDKVKLECPKGHRYKVSPKHFVHSGSRCPACSVKRRASSNRRTHQEFEDIVFQKVGKEYSIIGEYYNSTTHITMRHNSVSCDFFEWDIIPNNFLRGQRCPICVNREVVKRRTKTTEQFRKEVEALSNGEYVVLGEYTNTHTPIKMKHLVCDLEWDVRPSSFFKGNKVSKVQWWRSY